MGISVYILHIKEMVGGLVVSYGVELTGKEILYFFFKKKVCPVCGAKMKRLKKVENLGEGLDSVRLGQYYIGERHVVTFFYQLLQMLDKILDKVRDLILLGMKRAFM